MKSMIISLLSAALVCGCNCKSLLAQSKSNPFGIASTKVVELRVTGMTCRSCEDHISGALSKNAGVLKSHVRFAENSATVTYDPSKTTEAEIINTVNETGYTALLKESNEKKESKKNEGSAQIIRDVSFFEVPLVCGAAPEIGCGSKSKPVLLGLENKNDAVSEAWLNRTGTVIAVVWKKTASPELRKATAETVFDENNMNVAGISDPEYKNLLDDFSNKKNWYRGKDVDKLSIEEADVIAKRLVTRINSKTSLSKEKSEKLQTELTSVFKSTFLNLNPTADINSNEEKVYKQNEQKVENQILEAGNKFLNETEMKALKDAVSLGWRPTKKENKNAKSCCSPKKTS